jgi:hypothetical protein
MERRAFTRRANGRVSTLETDIGVFPVGSAVKPIPGTIHGFKAVWDTGATNTAISTKVAQALSSSPITFAKVGTGGGVVDAPVHLINIVLPDNFIVPNVQVTELEELNSCDVLIGMDIITLGDFAITHQDGKACFSFRIPSMKEIDFVPETVKHNSFFKSKVGQVVARTEARKRSGSPSKPRKGRHKNKHK